MMNFDEGEWAWKKEIAMVGALINVSLDSVNCDLKRSATQKQKPNNLNQYDRMARLIIAW